MEGWGNAALEVPQLEGAVGHEEGEVEVMMGACPGRSGLLTVPQSRALLGPGLSAVRGPLAPGPDLAFGPDSVT